MEGDQSHQVDVRHARCVLAIALNEASPTGDYSVGEWDAEHSSVLPDLRARILHRAMMDSSADVLLTMDSDTWIDDAKIFDVMAMVKRWYTAPGSSADAMIGVIVPQRDGRVNAWEAEGIRLSRDVLNAQRSQVHAIGSAIMFHNLDWYRSRGLNAGSFYAMAQSTAPGVATGAKDPPTFIGEDVWHCAVVRRLGGVIRAIDCGGVHGGAL